MKQSNQRIVGLDVHPDSFAGAILRGQDATSARVLSTSTRVELKIWSAGPSATPLKTTCSSWKPAATPLPWYGLQVAIGDISRFAQSNKLVAYLGLNPSVCQSGAYEGGGALKRHGRGPLRAFRITIIFLRS